MIEFNPTPLPQMTPFEPAAIPSDFADDGGVWLVQQTADLVTTDQPLYALIHLDDGVLWGRIDNGKLVIPLADDCDWVPQLRALTIQQCRLFSCRGEFFIWRIAEGKWRGRKLLDVQGVEYSKIEESQLLIGNEIAAKPPDDFNKSIRNLPDDFMAIREKSTGLRQVVPRIARIDDDHRLALVVRHYLSEDEDGQANVKCSRLVRLEEQDFKAEARNGNRQ
ncbi:MAG: CRISPR-associated protein Csx19 [Acidobacteriota bacterium]|nr:CRISPR-associated protein Csx19 [Acidobacteriota bacterium]